MKNFNKFNKIVKCLLFAQFLKFENYEKIYENLRFEYKCLFI